MENCGVGMLMRREEAKTLDRNKKLRKFIGFLLYIQREWGYNLGSVNKGVHYESG